VTSTGTVSRRARLSTSSATTRFKHRDLPKPSALSPPDRPFLIVVVVPHPLSPTAAQPVPPPPPSPPPPWPPRPNSVARVGEARHRAHLCLPVCHLGGPPFARPAPTWTPRPPATSPAPWHTQSTRVHTYGSTCVCVSARGRVGLVYFRPSGEAIARAALLTINQTVSTDIQLEILRKLVPELSKPIAPILGASCTFYLFKDTFSLSSFLLYETTSIPSPSSVLPGNCKLPCWKFPLLFNGIRYSSNVRADNIKLYFIRVM
jgi:hypothetical protein